MLSIKDHKKQFNVIRGYESAVDNALTGIGFGGSAIINTVSAPEALYITSSSADDSNSGTGAQTVKLTIYSQIGETINNYTVTATLNGTSNVTLPNDGNAITRMEVKTTGSGDTNAGVISVKTVDGDTVIRTIPAGVATSQSSLTTVSSRSKIKQLNVYTDATTTSNVPELYEVRVRTNTEKDSGDFSATVSGSVLATFFATPGQNEFEMYDELEAGEQVWCTAKNVTNSNSNAVSTEMVLYAF